MAWLDDILRLEAGLLAAEGAAGRRDQDNSVGFRLRGGLVVKAGRTGLFFPSHSQWVDMIAGKEVDE